MRTTDDARDFDHRDPAHDPYSDFYPALSLYTPGLKAATIVDAAVQERPASVQL
jgi:hypothetical protein